MGEAVERLIGDVQFEIGVELLPGGAGFGEADIVLAGVKEGWDGETIPTEIEIGRTCARLLEIASRRWSSHPDEMKLGPSEEVNKASEKMRVAAAELRSQYGGIDPVTGAVRGKRRPKYVGAGLLVYPPGVG